MSGARYTTALLIGLFLLAIAACGIVSTDRHTAESQPTHIPAEIVTAPAEVRLDARSELHRLSPLLFGMHVEWVEDGLGLWDRAAGRLRADIIDQLQPLAIPLFRFPGGIHADYYDWTMGVGPARSRPLSRNVFSGAEERHSFGSAEFIELLERTGAQALMTANFGTGTPEQAGAWARYLSQHKAPALLWEVGNETYLCDPAADVPNGRAIYHSGADYASRFDAFRQAIKAELPQARVGAIAHIDSGAFPLAPEGNRQWTEKMLSRLSTPADFFALHNAYAPVILDNAVDLEDAADRRATYRSLYAAAQQTKENLEMVAHTIDELSPANRGAPLAVTEMGPFFGLSGDRRVHADYVDQTRTLGSAIYVGSLLQVLAEDPRVFMACYTNPVHRWYGGLITDTAEGLVRTPTYYLYWLYATRFADRLVATEVSCPSFAATHIGIVKAREAIPDLVAHASVADDHSRLTAMLVNRSQERTLATTVRIDGFPASAVSCLVLTAPSAAVINGPAVSKSSISSSRDIRPEALECTVEGTEIQLAIPPNAIVSMVIQSGETPAAAQQ